MRLAIGDLMAFPFRRITLETPMAQYDVFKRLQDAVAPRKWWRLSRSEQGLEGVVSRTGFKVSRIIRYRNSFLPVVIGTVMARAQGGTRIDVVMRMTWFVNVFMALWMTAALAAEGLGLWMLAGHAGLRAGIPAGAAATAVVAAGMIVFGYVLCAVSFNLEARRARDLLAGILAPTQK